MTPEVSIAIISGIVAVLVAIISKTELFSRKHHRLIKDIELFGMLPNESTKKQDILKFIDQRIAVYIKVAKDHKRNGTDITVGIIFLIIGGYLTWFFVTLGSWWLLALALSIFILMIGVFGLVQGLKSAERDEKGRIVTKKQ